MVEGAADAGPGLVDDALPVNGPLVYDEEVHEPEEQDQEQDLRDPFEDHLKGSFEVECVEKFQENSQGHVDDGNDNWDLHLEGIDKDEFVVGDAPDGVDSEGVDTVGVGVYVLAVGDAVFDGVLVAGAEYVEIHAEEVVVDPSAVEGEETHHEDHVPELTDEGERAFADFIIEEDKVETQDEDDSSVGHVTEHDSEEEGEGDRREDGRVDLLVAGHSVGVGDFLGHDRVAVGVEGGGRFGEVELLYFGGGFYHLHAVD